MEKTMSVCSNKHVKKMYTDNTCGRTEDETNICLHIDLKDKGNL